MSGTINARANGSIWREAAVVSAAQSGDPNWLI
jgi:hypothetical protein